MPALPVLVHIHRTHGGHAEQGDGRQVGRTVGHRQGALHTGAGGDRARGGASSSSGPRAGRRRRGREGMEPIPDCAPLLPDPCLCRLRLRPERIRGVGRGVGLAGGTILRAVCGGRPPALLSRRRRRRLLSLVAPRAGLRRLLLRRSLDLPGGGGGSVGAQGAGGGLGGIRRNPRAHPSRVGKQRGRSRCRRRGKFFLSRIPLFGSVPF